MTTNLALASIKATGATTSRTFAAHFGDVVNPKGFGAVGDGSTDDTAAFQAMIDYCFGPPDAPHGTSGGALNRSIYIPKGSYKVTPPTALTITGAVAGIANLGGAGGNCIKLTVSSIPGFGTNAATFKTGQLVSLPTAVGGINDNGQSVNSSYGIIVDDATHITLLDTKFGGTYSGSGTTVTRAALTMTYVVGARIMGDGKDSCGVSTTSTGSVFGINGMYHTHWEGFGVGGSGIATSVGVGIDLDWDYNQTGGSGSQSTQTNSFVDMAFGGLLHGVRCGKHGQQVSENSFYNCNFTQCGLAGLSVYNYNALQMSIYGGNIQSCYNGIYIYAGSVPAICGVAFQASTNYDILAERTVGDASAIMGCRSESDNFVFLQAGYSAHISCCTQTSGAAGIFAHMEHGSGQFAGSIRIDCCYSVNGTITGNGDLAIFGSKFLNAGHISGFSGRIHQYNVVADGTTNTTVANLPTAAAALKGLRMYVTDATATTFASTVAGGGSTTVPVYCDGTNWKIG